MSPDEEEVMTKSSRTCPRCRTALRVVERGGEQLDLCTECGGIWFDPSELDDIVGDHSPVELLILITDSLKGDRLPCPECGRTMTSKEVYDVYVDYCEECRGIWMDKGETGKVRSMDRMMKYPFDRESIEDRSKNFWESFKEKYSSFE
ncbi:MAG: zf-TFIIB domain-containing protein [Thermoplasmatota archaeon]